MIRFIFAAFLCATPVLAQDRIDPESIELDTLVRKAFRDNPEQLIAHYQSQLRGFAIDGEKLNLSTLDALIDLVSSAERGNSVGNFLGYDLDWDGQITRREYNSVFSSDFKLAEGSADAWEQGAANKDLNNDDVITLAELLSGAELAHPTGDVPTRLRYVDEMRHWDLDGDGYVSQSEVAEVIAANIPE